MNKRNCNPVHNGVEMTNEIKEVLASIENCIEMWRQGRKLGDETIIELLYLQSKILTYLVQSSEREDTLAAPPRTGK
jgi:hypothetical protein